MPQGVTGSGHPTKMCPVQATQLTRERLDPQLNNQHIQTAFALPIISLAAPTTNNQHITPTVPLVLMFVHIYIPSHSHMR